jgi:predicted TIM-barrel fold metal-dependent hydrolase
MARRSDGAGSATGLPLTRRNLLLAAGSLWLPGVWAATPPPTPVPLSVGAPRHGLIDVHHHWSNGPLQAWWGHTGTAAATWAADKALAAMDDAGVATAILSVTQPGVWKSSDSEGSIKLARECNEAMARLSQDHRSRFGYFAVIALPMVRASVAEVGYSLDALKADGVGLLSSYDGKYLGDPSFIPVLEELNARRAVVYVHPTVPMCCGNLVPDIPATATEVPGDTTRTIESLLLSGALARFDAIRFIFAHGGGSLPFLAERMLAAIDPHPPADKGYLSAYNARAALARLYFDCASVANPPAWAALTTFTTPERILFGTDYPASEIRAGLGSLRAMEQRFGLPSVDTQSIEYGNAQQLFAPRLS